MPFGGVSVRAHVIPTLTFEMLSSRVAVRATSPLAALRCAARVRTVQPLVRSYSSKDDHSQSQSQSQSHLSNEQAELLRMLRTATQQEKARQEQASLGLAGVALAQGATSDSRAASRWTGEGKKWSDISAGQKVARATVNTSRFFFISAGAALTFVIAYALSSELFATNSPTVIYGEACKLIEKSDKVHAYLLRPYRFQTNLSEYASYSPLNPPGNLHRPSQTVSSVEYHDAQTGHDKMFIHFFIEAREKGTELSYWQVVRGAIITGADWLKYNAVRGVELIEDWWKETADEASAKTAEPAAPPREPWWITRKLRSAASSVGSLVGSSRDAFGLAGVHLVGSTAGQTEPGTWSTGEVHIEMVKDANGRYQYHRFFIDMPSTRAPLRSRVWLDRGAGDLPTR